MIVFFILGGIALIIGLIVTLTNLKNVRRRKRIMGTPTSPVAQAPGNGPMTAFLAPDRATVDRAWAVALAHGGTDEGPPGLRPEYHAHYYGAYFRDTEGNKLCVACHEAQTPP